MKKVFEMVSDMILPGIIFISIVAILTGGALLSKAGQRMDVEKEDFSNSKDTGAVADVCAREEPTITCVGKKNWNIGEAIRINDVFQAVDTEGNPLTVKLADITDESGNSVMGSYQEATQTAAFSHEGIYTFHLKAIDSERKTTEAKFSFAVDER